jgi:threonylcarbamoyladenosine tRNA methylthiotransferase MtaB
MRRRYRVERFIDRLEQIRDRLPNPAFSTDMIVGFPGETEREFAESLSACRRARFMEIHIFPFSARRGTPAARLPGQVAASIKKERCRRMAELGQELAAEYCRTLAGTTLEVLVEGCVPGRPGWVYGLDRRYVAVKAPGSPADVRKFVNVVAEVPKGEFLRARR